MCAAALMVVARPLCRLAESVGNKECCVHCTAAAAVEVVVAAVLNMLLLLLLLLLLR